jgi:sporulation protein YlmC with PRC-barrel domain
MTAELVRLSEFAGEIVDESADLRRRKVLDSAGEEIGRVEEVLVDPGDATARMIEVGHGGLLGMGQSRFLLPLDAVEAVDQDAVRVALTRERIEGAPPYEAVRAAYNDPVFRRSLFDYYSFEPAWDNRPESAGPAPHQRSDRTEA